jgi:protein-S-isoprenylcysteine O-methyltransferase Ste14
VAAQWGLLLALWATPTSGLWGRPGWLLSIASLVFWVGVAYAALGALWLRGALTPLPLPREGGALVDSGPYRLSRHPIYLGLLAAGLGMTLRRAHPLAVLLFGALVTVLHFAARWEESHLTARYPGYVAYARRTGRILPRLRL